MGMSVAHGFEHEDDYYYLGYICGLGNKLINLEIGS
jgi:hypothetical protein